MRAAPFVVLVLALTACNTPTPTAPTPSSPAPVSPLPLPAPIAFISVVGDQWIPTTSGPVQMTARLYTSGAEYFDGAEYVVWRLDPPDVVSIDKQGRVTPLMPGWVDVVAEAGGRIGRHRVRVLPIYSGTWTGRYRITDCSGLPDPRTCGRNMFDQSTGLPIFRNLTLHLSQDRDEVTGTMISGQFATTDAVTGYVRVSGTLVLEATVSQAQFGLEPRRLLNWSSTADAAVTSMSGGYTWISPGIFFGYPYTGRTEQEFINLARTP